MTSKAYEKIKLYFEQRELQQKQAKEDDKRIKEGFLAFPAANVQGWVKFQELPAAERQKEAPIGSKEELYKHFNLHELKTLLNSRKTEALQELEVVKEYRLISKTAADNFQLLESELAQLDTGLQLLKEYEYPNTVSTFTESVAAGMDQYTVDTAKQAADKLQVNPADFTNSDSKEVK